MSSDWVDKADNPGMANWGFKSDDVYGAVVLVNLADLRFRVALTADFESSSRLVSQSAQLDDRSWPGDA